MRNIMVIMLAALMASGAVIYESTSDIQQDIERAMSRARGARSRKGGRSKSNLDLFIDY